MQIIDGFSVYSYMRGKIVVKTLKIQRQIFTSRDKELTKTEYERLVDAAKSKKNENLYMLMQTICSSGIRVSELCYITIETTRGNHIIKNSLCIDSIYI